ncbi:hypothetical protein CHUAL_001385 [Chamberlinius hualienensis]
MTNNSLFLTVFILWTLQIITALDDFQCRSAHCRNFVASMKDLVNSSASPCEDFYQYSCSRRIHETLNSKGDPMSSIESRVNSILTELLQEDRKPTEPKAVQLLKTFYATCSNSSGRDVNGNEVLIKKLNNFGGWPILQLPVEGVNFNEVDLGIFLGQLRRLGYSQLIKLNVKVDERNSSRYITVANVPTVDPLPDAYGNLITYIGFLATHSTVIRTVAQLLGIENMDEAVLKNDIKEIFSFQKSLLQIANKSSENWTAYKVLTVNKIQMSVYQKFNLLKYLNSVFQGIKTFSLNDELMIPDEVYLNKLVSLLESVDPRTVQNYVLWQIVKDVSEDGDLKLRAAVSVYKGNPNVIRETCVKEAKGFMSYAALRLYLTNNEHRQSVNTVTNTVQYLKKALSLLIDESSWMDPATKERAQNKLKLMRVKVGYPSWVLNGNSLDSYYGKLKQMSNNHLENIFTLSDFFSGLELSLVNQPTDKQKWELSPLIANAFYHRSLNEIYIPVAIIQEPLFHRESANFGAIGSVIGHEMCHGFESKSGIASNERLDNWLSALSTETYNLKSNCVKEQYDKYCTYATRNRDVICVNGGNTLTENIADIGGVKASFKGFLQWSFENVSPIIGERFFPSSEKLFFLTYSQLWCSKINPSLVEGQMIKSINSPHKYRLIGPLENLEDFHLIFNCSDAKSQSGCRIW